MKAPAKTINAELQYRLEFLRLLNRMTTDAAKAQQHLKTSAWSKASRWTHELLIRAARESINELAPVKMNTQDIQLADFVQSLERV